MSTERSEASHGLGAAPVLVIDPSKRRQPRAVGDAREMSEGDDRTRSRRVIA